jgi:hypothetical protein
MNHNLKILDLLHVLGNIFSPLTVMYREELKTVSLQQGNRIKELRSCHPDKRELTAILRQLNDSKQVVRQLET